MKPYRLISDGACSGNPGPGGYGTIVMDLSDTVYEIGGSESQTTNNRMELLGYLEGLVKILSFRAPAMIHVVLDSSYVLKGAEQYVWNWAKNGWKTQAGEAVKNQDLWERVLSVLRESKQQGFEIRYHVVKGHSGHPANDRVDLIAVSFSQKIQGLRSTTETLFQGHHTDYQTQYGVNLTSAELFLNDSATVSGKKTKVKALYLVSMNGQVQRFDTWSECEKVVKGRSGVKYKKVTSEDEERAVLKSWGMG
jgi:ribonuclease HI